jgi:hypothetical protein
VKKKSHEKLTDTNIQHVIGLLETEKPISKKEACSILNISYNVNRLANIIEEYEDNLDYKNKRKAQNKGKPARPEEIVRVIEEYLDGDSIMEIGSRLYRSTSFIKGIINRVGVPQRASKEEMKRGTPVLPEACIAEEFESGEIVWCPRYNAAAEVLQELTIQRQFEHLGWRGYQNYAKCLDYEKVYGSKCYSIYVIKESELDRVFGFNSFQLAYDLGKLRHLEQYGIDVKSRMSK